MTARVWYTDTTSWRTSTGSCWPGIKTIARDMNLSRSTVKRALADLEQHGYLAKLPRYRPNGSNTSNLYTLK